jgi:hypothetical protein
MEREYSEPMSTILRQQDSLKLTSMQADSIAGLNRAYTIQTDAIWTLLRSISRSSEVLRPERSVRSVHARAQSERGSSDEDCTDVKDLLTAEQRRKLPPLIASYLEPRYLASIRSGTATFTAGQASAAADPVFAGGGDVLSRAQGRARAAPLRSSASNRHSYTNHPPPEST